MGRRILPGGYYARYERRTPVIVFNLIPDASYHYVGEWVARRIIR